MACHIKLDNLALTYRWKAFQKNIFQDLNLCIPHGAFVTIKGGNGSGKSSLIRLILGLAAPDAGEITINGDLVRARSGCSYGKKGGESIWRRAAISSVGTIYHR